MAPVYRLAQHDGPHTRYQILAYGASKDLFIMRTTIDRKGEQWLRGHLSWLIPN